MSDEYPTPNDIVLYSGICIFLSFCFGIGLKDDSVRTAEINIMTSLDKADAHGFTLLEVMVAVAILAIAMVAVLKANVQSLEALIQSREITTAAMLAASKLSEVEASGEASLTEFSGDFGEDFPDYTWQLENEPTGIERLVKVAVIVKHGADSVDRSTRIEELIFVK